MLTWLSDTSTDVERKRELCYYLFEIWEPTLKNMNSFIDLDGDLSLPEIDDISMSHHADVSVNSRTRDKTSTTTNIQDQIRKIQACKIELVCLLSYQQHNA